MKILACDPGESFGYCTAEDNSLLTAGTSEMWAVVHALGRALVPLEDEPIQDEELFLRFAGVDHVVIEDWALYPWELPNLAWDQCRTARAIGALQFICQKAGVPFTLQPAKIKETALAAGVEELYLSPRHENRHANDSIQHLVYFNLRQGGAPVRWAEEGVAAA